MKIEATYRHRLKSSRRFVFENIMDLEHVFALHRKWFRNLRVRVQRPDYVEYRLTSQFYGLKQDLLVRGGPVDADTYWYEFLGPLAKIRVDGTLGGADGDLLQTERITYTFSWYLAPFFFLLKPIFRRQKADILSDDSALLERVYKLDRAGFKRVETGTPKVVVHGGEGFFGRLAVEDLLEHSNAQVVVASRHPKCGLFQKHGTRVTVYQSDLDDYGSVLSTIKDAKVAVCCSGPFQGMSLNLLRACIEAKVNYVDVADDRDFVERCHALSPQVEAAGICAFVGCSVVPGISSLLTQYCRGTVEPIQKTRISITPGTRNPRGAGSFLCLLATVGQNIDIPHGDGWRTVSGWTGREQVEFPPPLGKRWVYFVVDIADYWTQPHYFGVPAVEFKIGSELDSLNRSLELLGWLKRLLGIPNGRWLLAPSRLIVRLAAPFGTSQGAVMVEVSSDRAQMAASVFAEEHGEVIPALLPSIATQMILNREVSHQGIMPLHSWLPADRLVRELAKRRVRAAVRRGQSDWALLDANNAASLDSAGLARPRSA